MSVYRCGTRTPKNLRVNCSDWSARRPWADDKEVETTACRDTARLGNWFERLQLILGDRAFLLIRDERQLLAVVRQPARLDRKVFCGEPRTFCENDDRASVDVRRLP